MEENKIIEPETVKNDAPKPGTKAYVEAELAAAKAEQEALKAELEALKAEQEKAEQEALKAAENAAEPEDPKEKMVKIRIPRTKKNEEDVFVSVNLRTWLIKRGVEVEVPECVAEVLRHQEKMLEEIMLFEDQHQR